MDSWAMGLGGAMAVLEEVKAVPFDTPTTVSATVVFDNLCTRHHIAPPALPSLLCLRVNLSYGWCRAADAVSEKEFTFEVEFTLMLSWYDEQVFRKCDNVHPWAEPLGCPASPVLRPRS